VRYCFADGGERLNQKILRRPLLPAMNWNLFTLIAIVDAALVVFIDRRRRARLRRAEELKSEGVRAAAVVAALKPVGRLASRYQATLAFRDLDGFMQHFEMVWPSAEIARRGVRVGSSVPIHYLAASPASAAVDELPQRLPSQGMVLIAGACVLLAGTVLSALA
jgi:hypothetical protein